jgi:hypothetical protein
MKKYFRQIIILNILFIIFLISAYGQEKIISDTLSVSSGETTKISEPVGKERKNIVNINITNPMLISNKFQIIGYERILPNNQSFTVNVGIFDLPKFLNNKIADSLGIVSESSKNGFHFSIDYRFYLKKLNKFDAPRGVYLAPYYTYNQMSRKNTWNLEGHINEVSTNTSIGIHTLGFELGYQFIFWDRVALDLILLGPGMGHYGIKTKIGTTLNAEDESILFDKINEILSDRIPGYDKIIDVGEYSRKRYYNTTTIGYRYVIRLGFLF